MDRILKTARRPMVAALMGAGLIATAAHAQTAASDKLDSVVVTATKTGERPVQSVPLAISVLSEKTIEAAGIMNAEDVAKLAPGVSYTANINYAIPSIRGIGTNMPFISGDPSVVTTIDGVYIARPSAAFLDFFDVQRIEVLRGPQGTVYGRNATGGAMNVVTRDPDGEFNGAVKAGFGNYNERILEGRLSGPLSETVRASVSARKSSHDPYVINTIPGGSKYFEDDSTSVKGKLVFASSKDLKWTLGADHSKQNGNPNSYSVLKMNPPSDHWVTSANDPAQAKAMSQGVSLTTDYDMGTTKLKNIMAYRKGETRNKFDIDFSNLSLVTVPGSSEHSRQFTEELTLSGKTGALQWVVGGFYLKESGDIFWTVRVYPGATGVPGFGLADTFGIYINTDSKAVFGQGTYALTDQLGLTAGLRYTRDEKTGRNYGGHAEYHGGADPFPPGDMEAAKVTAGGFSYTATKTYSAMTPKIGIEYQQSKDTLLYASASKGFKSGGFNPVTNAANPSKPFNEEKVTALEAGMKNTILNGSGILNLALFANSYKGYQQAQFEGTGTEYVLNLGEVKTSGFEVETAIKASSRFQLGGNIANLKATYNDPNLRTRNNEIGAFVNSNGNTVNDAPKWMASVYGEYSFPIDSGKLALRGDLQYKGEVFYSPSNNHIERAEARALANASLTWTSPNQKFEAALHVRNLTNKQYITGAGLFFNITGRPGAPRTALASLRYNF